MCVVLSSAGACTHHHRAMFPAKEAAEPATVNTHDGQRLVVVPVGEGDDARWETRDGRRVADEEVRSAESVSRGTGLLEGLGGGFVVGAVVGAVIGYGGGDDDGCSETSWVCWSHSAEEKALIGGAAVGLLGAGVGAIVGLAVGHRDVYGPSGSANLSFIPLSGGGATALSWRF